MWEKAICICPSKIEHKERVTVPWENETGGRLMALFQTLLQRLVEETTAAYGESLTSLVVFGSVGRGTPIPSSDIDVLLVAKHLPRGRMPRVRQFLQVERALEPDLEAAQRQGLSTCLSPLFRTEDEMGLGGLIFLDMIEDGKILYDRGSFFEAFIVDLQARLISMGSVRVRRGGAWHWVLKPDLRPGEVFEV